MSLVVVADTSPIQRLDRQEEEGQSVVETTSMVGGKQ
jgi:hypothetical protein